MIIDVVKILLENQVDQNARDVEQKTALHYAAMNGHSEICEMLIEYGVEMNTSDVFVFTPLHWAAKQGHSNVCWILLNNQVEKNSKRYFLSYRRKQGLKDEHLKRVGLGLRK